jgi:hypothetical protein
MGAGAVGRMQYDNNMAADVRLTAGDGAHAPARADANKLC